MATEPDGALLRIRSALAGRYDVERELGRGGMAVVYLARDPRHERQVAIKVLEPELAACVGHERFLQEIALTARLSHPHILPLLDSGSAGSLLFYAMPYVEGESLRHRLDRETQLTIEDALRIAREVADALGAAHRQGVVHRDIKPANILLHEGHAVVSDFGIARAITSAGGARLTATGLAIGTAGYMSPEQATGEAVDERSDIYSLGCVLYEMLTGEAPFTGPSAQAIVAKQLGLPVPSAAMVRETVSHGLDAVLARALAKVPADRFATVEEFIAALDSSGSLEGAAAGAERTRPRWVVGSVMAGAVGLVLIAIGVARERWTGAGATAPDTTRYAILPFEKQVGVGALNENQLLRDALARWSSGVSLADQVRVRDALARPDSATLPSRAAADVARGAGAGRYFRGTVSRVGDSLRVEAGVYSAADGAQLTYRAIRLPRDLRGADSGFASLADRLLLRELLPEGTPALAGTRSLPARQSFLRGQHAMEAWDLPRADSAFTAATTFDPAYAQAQLWVALARAWRGTQTAQWNLPAQQAVTARVSLTAGERDMASAILAQSLGDGAACERWRTLARTESRDYAAWYGYGYCLRRDSAVVRDRASPSGWRFRSSYEQTVRAYRRAFELRPAILSAFRDNHYEGVRSLLRISATAVVPGRAITPDTITFVGRPELAGSVVALVPYPVSVARGPREPWNAKLVDLAVRRQRETFRGIAVAWVSAFPRSASAMEALAVSLELLGSPAALDTLRRARALASDRAEKVRIASGEIWMSVKFGAPTPARLLEAKLLADSLLAGPAEAPLTARRLAGIAALTGRARLAASLARRSAMDNGWAPVWLAGSAPALLVFASMGGPLDSLSVLEQRVEAQLKDSSLALQREWFGRPAGLAAPVWRFRAVREMRGKYNPFIDALAAWVSGDTETVRRLLGEIRTARRTVPPADRSIDALYPEAAMLTWLRDDRGAIAWLDPTLNALEWTAPGTFEDPARPGALVNAMALRADLAARTGDLAGARRWARAVVILWSDADDFLQPVVRRMRRLSSS